MKYQTLNTCLEQSYHFNFINYKNNYKRVVFNQQGMLFSYLYYFQHSPTSHTVTITLVQNECHSLVIKQYNILSASGKSSVFQTCCTNYCHDI